MGNIRTVSMDVSILEFRFIIFPPIEVHRIRQRLVHARLVKNLACKTNSALYQLVGQTFYQLLLMLYKRKKCLIQKLYILNILLDMYSLAVEEKWRTTSVI